MTIIRVDILQWLPIDVIGAANLKIGNWSKSNYTPALVILSIGPSSSSTPIVLAATPPAALLLFVGDTRGN